MHVSGRLLARNTLFNVAGQALPALVAAAAIPLTIHRMGPERFGLIGLAWVILGYFSYLDLGMSYAATRLLSQAMGRGEPHRLPPILGSAVAVQTAAGVAGAVALFAVAPLIVNRWLHLDPSLAPDAILTFRVLAVAVPIVLISASLRAVLAAGQRFGVINTVTVPASMLNFLIPLAGALAGWSLARIAVFLVAARGVVMLAYLSLATREVPGLIRGAAPQRGLIRELLGFGLWTAVTNVLAPVFGSLDRFLLGAFRNVTAVGFYTGPQEMVLRLSILPGSLAATLFPALAALDARNEPERVRDLYGRSIRFLLISVGAIALPLVALGPDLVRLWLGAEVAEQAGVAVQFLAAGIVVNAMAYVPSAYLHSINRPDLPARMHLFELPVFLLLAWLLMRPWGVAGAGAVWCARATLDAGLLFLASRRHGMSWLPSRDRSQVWPITALVVTFAAAALTPYVATGVTLRLMMTLALTAVFGWLGWHFVLSSVDRSELIGMAAAGSASGVR